MLKLVLLGLVSATVAFDYKSLPGLNHDTWWGPPGKEVDDPEIKDFQIEFKKKDIDSLLYHLENKREFVPPIEGSAYNNGINTDTIVEWVDYWQNKYNFTEREAYMNKYPHKRAQIQGLWIHFIHVKPEVPEGKTCIPVMMSHGFPGSIREFYDSIPLITADSPDRNFVVELVVPSVPGFGYSDYTNKTGMGHAEMAFIYRNLMHKLGHKKFFYQGGDWGALIGANIVTFFPDEVLGYHTNFGVALTDKAFSMLSGASIDPTMVMAENLVSRLYPLEKSFKHMAQESGYFHLQATKPDTIGILVNHPIGLMAWVFQQFSIASRRSFINETDGGLDLYTHEELLDNLMIYWCENKAPTAFRIYAESFNLRNEHMGYRSIPTTVPTVVVQTSDELVYMPKEMLETKFSKLVKVQPLDTYGHFFAFEAPEKFSELVLSGLQDIIEYRKTHNLDAEKESSS